MNTLWRMGSKDPSKIFLKAYDAFGADLLRHAIIRCGDQEIAKDLVSETFLKTWQYLQKEKVENLRALFYKVLNNLLIDHYRSKRPQTYLEDLPESGEPPAAVSLERELDIKFAAETARKYLALLPVEQREIFQYKYIDGLDAREIKVLTGKSLTNIYVIVHRGLKTLKQKLNANEA